MSYSIHQYHTDEKPVYETMLNACSNLRIFSIEPDGNDFSITDECDCCFGFRITRDQLLALAEEIKALAQS